MVAIAVEQAGCEDQEVDGHFMAIGVCHQNFVRHLGTAMPRLPL